MRTIPLSALQAMYQISAEEFPVILLTISRGEDVIRLSSDPTERISEDPIAYGTVSRDHTFIFFPFEITLPQDQAETVPRMTVRVENVSAEIGWWLRESTEKPLVTVEILASGDLENPIAVFPDFELSGFRGGTMTVEATMILSSLENEPFPAGTFNPTHFPGLF